MIIGCAFPETDREKKKRYDFHFRAAPSIGLRYRLTGVMMRPVNSTPRDYTFHFAINRKLCNNNVQFLALNDIFM